MNNKHIIFEKTDTDMFMHFFKRLEEIQDSLKNIVILNREETIEIGFSIRRNSQNVIKKIEEILAHTILVFYKSNFIYKNISLPEGMEQYKNILSKSLAVFDRASEIEEIKEKICLGDKLYVESFYIFKLQSFRLRWEEICNLFLDNIESLQLAETFNELLRYLIFSTECSDSEVYINETPNQIFLVSKDGSNLIDPINRSVNYVMEVVSELIILAPKGIVLKKNTFEDSDLIETLIKLFQEKVVVNAWQTFCLSVKLIEEESYAKLNRRKKLPKNYYIFGVYDENYTQGQRGCRSYQGYYCV